MDFSSVFALFLSSLLQTARRETGTRPYHFPEPFRTLHGADPAAVMMQDQTLRIRVLFFAIAGELAGENSIELELDSPATASDAETKLKERYDWLGKRLSSYRIAVDEEFARSDTPVRDGSELAIIPPVSGG